MIRLFYLFFFMCAYVGGEVMPPLRIMRLNIIFWTDTILLLPSLFFSFLNDHTFQCMNMEAIISREILRYKEFCAYRNLSACLTSLLRQVCLGTPLVCPLTASCLYATPSMSLDLITYLTPSSWKLLPQAAVCQSLGLAFLCGNSKKYFLFRSSVTRSLGKTDRLVPADGKVFKHRPVSKAADQTLFTS